MKAPLKRRAVYAATIVTMLVMVTGFALASGLLPVFTSTVVKGNQGAVSTADTIYSPGISSSLFWASAGGATGSCTTTTFSSVIDLEIVTAWVAGGPGACTTTQDYIVQLNFTSAASLTAGTTYTDQFIISSEFGTAATYTTSAAEIACTTVASTGNQCQATLNIDTGIPTTDAQPAVEAIDITVTGS
jgi:hypothetical protein